MLFFMTYVAIVIGKRGKKKVLLAITEQSMLIHDKAVPKRSHNTNILGTKRESNFHILRGEAVSRTEWVSAGWHPSVFPQHFFTGWEYGVTEHTAYKNSRLVKSPYIGCFHTIWVLVAVYPLFLSSISNPILFRACLTINTRSHLIIIGPGEEYPGLMFTWIFLENMFNSQF